MIEIFDIVYSYINDIIQSSGGTIRSNELRMTEIKSSCEILDEIFYDNGGTSVSVSIGENGEITVTMVLSCFSANKYNQSYFDLMSMCSSFSVSNTANNDMNISFVLSAIVFEYNSEQGASDV